MPLTLFILRIDCFEQLVAPFHRCRDPRQKHRHRQVQRRTASRCSHCRRTHRKLPDLHHHAFALTAKRPRARYIVGLGPKAQVALLSVMPTKVRDIALRKVSGQP